MEDGFVKGLFESDARFTLVTPRQVSAGALDGPTEHQASEDSPVTANTPGQLWRDDAAI